MKEAYKREAYWMKKAKKKRKRKTEALEKSEKAYRELFQQMQV